MNHLKTILPVVLVMTMAACASGPASSLDPIEISQEALDNYWVVEHEEIRFNVNRRIHPDRVATGGVARVQYRIDSSGEVAWTRVVESEPVDMWGQLAEDVISANRYQPAPGNAQRQPVIVTREVRFEGGEKSVR